MRRGSYRDNSDRAVAWLAERAVAHVDALVLELVDEIRAVINEAAPRTGAEYFIPGTKTLYTASAPGEPPATREGLYLAAWKGGAAVVVGHKVIGAAINDRRTEDGEDFIGWIMELGTLDGSIEARPHIGVALERVAARHGLRVVYGKGQ